MTGVAALPAMSIPDIATAMPIAGGSASGTGSIFDALIALLAPTVSDQSGGPAQATPQATPPVPAGASDAMTTQPIVPDGIASLEAALGDAMAALQLLPSQPQSGPAIPNTALPIPTPVESAGLPPQPQNRPARSEQPGASAPANMVASSNDSLMALAMILPQLPVAGDAPAAPINPSVEDVTIGNNAKTDAPNPLPGMATNFGPQEDVANTAAQNLPADSTAQTQLAKGDAKAMPAQAAIPFALSQAGNIAAALSLKGTPSPAAEKPAANGADRRGQTETIARASKTTAATSVAQADNAATPLPNSDVSAPAGRAASNSSGHTETATHPSQDLTAIAGQRSDNLASPAVSNGYASALVANHAPIELSSITAANAMWANAPQTGAVPMNLVLSPAGVVPDPASVDALALRIAAKSADGESQFQIRLDPPSLGRIEIHLNMDSQGNAQAQLSADRPQTLDALQRDSGALERALKDAGLDLPGGLSFSLKGDGKSAAWRDAQNSSRGRAMQIDALDAANGTAAILGLTPTGQGWGAASMRLDISV